MPDWEPPHWMKVGTGLSWRFLVMAAALGVVALIVAGLSAVVMPVLFGLVLASVFSPLAEWLRARGLKPSLAAMVCLFLLAIAISFLLWLGFEALVGPWESLSAEIGKGLDVLTRELGVQFDGDIADLSESVRTSTGALIGFLLGGALGLVSVAASLATTLLLTLLVVFYFLKDGDVMWRWFTAKATDDESLVDRVGRAMWGKVNSFIRGTAAVAVVDGAGIALGALLIGTPSVAAIGVITFTLAFIPYFGAIFAGAIAVAISLADGGLQQGLAMVVVVIVVQQLESNVLQPMLVGRAVRLHPLVVALGVIAGGTVAGVVGMFLAIPMIAAVVAATVEVKAARDPVDAIGQVVGSTPNGGASSPNA